jgi:predicted acylesterase/phospholipase RssA/CRP-like cAMP-binding protein
MLDQEQINFLSVNKIFSGISHDALLKLSQNMCAVSFSGGKYIMHEGEPASDMFILFQGRLGVYSTKDKSALIAEIGVGAVVGELALLTDMPRVADVRAIRDSVLIKVDQATFRSWVSLHPESAFKMISDSIQRLLPKEGAYVHPTSTLAIIPGEAGLDLRSFAQQLLESVQPYKRCKLLSDEDETVKQAIARGEAVSPAYLNECENKHDLLIYLAGSSVDAWGEQCIRQADKVLKVVSATMSNPSSMLQYLHSDKNILAEKYLVVLHSAETQIPKQTDKLMKVTQSVHVLHIKNTEDYRRIGRFLTGHAVSLVLSGGGIRGAAHIGLYNALRSKGIPIDMVGGSSFGSLAAAVIGLRMSKDNMKEMSHWVQKTLPGLMDYTLPFVSLLKGQRLNELLTTVFSTDLLLEDLWIPTFSIATNMTKADIEVFDRGLAWENIRASISLPGIFPPVVKDGKVLVDGATFNNLPSDIMRDRNNGGKVIASSVSTDLASEHYYSNNSSVSGFEVLVDRFRSQPHEHLPPLLEMLVNAQFVGAQRHMNQVKYLCDYYIDLNVTEHPMLDVNHWDEIVEKGYQRGLRLIEDMGLSRESLGIKD